MIKAVIFDMFETLVTHFESPVYMAKQISNDIGISEEKFRLRDSASIELIRRIDAYNPVVFGQVNPEDMRKSIQEDRFLEFKKEFEENVRERFPFVNYMDVFFFDEDHLKLIGDLEPERKSEIISKKNKNFSDVRLGKFPKKIYKRRHMKGINENIQKFITPENQLQLVPGLPGYQQKNFQRAASFCL